MLVLVGPFSSSLCFGRRMLCPLGLARCGRYIVKGVFVVKGIGFAI